MSRRTARSWALGTVVLWWACTIAADPLRLRADAVGAARAPAGLIMLQGENKEAPWFEAEALVWTGVKNEPTVVDAAGVRHATGDVLVLTLKVREPHGYGEVRGGRFVFASGAIRPIAIDGGSIIARLPTGLTVEAVGGAPVV